MFRLIFAALLLFVSQTVLFAAEITPISGESGPSRRDMSESSFNTYLNRYRNQGYRMSDIDVYRDGSRTRYAQNWRRNDGRNWAVEQGLDTNQYSARFAVHSNNGMRATDIEGYRVGNQMRYAGLWVENRENISWALWRNLTGPGFREKNEEQAARGRVIVDAEAYMTGDGLRFAAIWYADNRPQDTFFRRGVSRSTYLDLVRQKQNEGFKLVDFESYQNDNGETRYIGLWKRGVPGRVIVRTNRDEQTYVNYFWQYDDEGYRPSDFERNGNRYSAIWKETQPQRARYPGKSALDAELDGFLPSMNTNAPPGVSAAIVLNGTRIWQRGDGFADIASGKKANASTIYYLASVSKPIAATLFGRLEDRGRLEDETAVSLSGSDTTRSHLPELPTFHTHLLRDLLGHTACIGSYGSRTHVPDNDNYTSHFDNQRDALPRYMNTGLLQSVNGVQITSNSGAPGCVPGQFASYSNHGYGMLGAVMESATGRDYKDLLRSELADPFGLPSIRAMYEGTNPVSTRHRATPHNNANNPISYRDSSWKVTVGGTEGNAKDLARFGWLAGSGRLTSVAFRDNVLFNRMPVANIGYAWNINTISNRRVASHTGSGSGSRTMLWVWPDHGLSIAILVNGSYDRTNSDPMDTLMRSLANIVFSN